MTLQLTWFRLMKQKHATWYPFEPEFISILCARQYLILETGHEKHETHAYEAGGFL